MIFASNVSPLVRPQTGIETAVRKLASAAVNAIGAAVGDNDPKDQEFASASLALAKLQRAAVTAGRAADSLDNTPDL